MKKIFALTIVIITLGFLVFFTIKSIGPAQTIPGAHVIINDVLIPVEVADEYEEHWRGLSNRQSLGEGSGMFFVFGNKQVQSFWMKDMNFSLDIVWIDDDKIVKIDKDLPPGGSEPDIKYSSIHPVNHVLEVNAGFIDRNDIGVGDTVRLELGE